MSSRDEQGGRQEGGGPVPGLQCFPAQPPLCQGGAFSSFNSSARMMAPVLTQTMGCNPLVTSIQWVQPVFANQMKEHRLCCSVKLWMRVCHLLTSQSLAFACPGADLHPCRHGFLNTVKHHRRFHLGFKEFRFQGQIVETCLSCTSHNPKQECTSELVGPAVCL